MGRPLGVPDDPAFQTRVLTAALKLMEAPGGPVLVDYPEDAPPVEGPTALSCPVSFSLPLSDRSDVEKLAARFVEEIALMRPWYDLAVRERTRTTVGVSGMEPDVVPRIMAGEELGSRFLARPHRLKGYRQWLRFGAMATGRVIVDDGAAKALRNNKSLLPAGIAKVEGSFRDGDVVEIFNRAMEKIGVGLINLSSADVEAIVSGERRPNRSEEAIHKDRLLLVG